MREAEILGFRCYFGSDGDEEEMKKVSVIVPIYKGDCYISNIIHMLEENWKFANKMEIVEIELIFVNDYPAEELKIENKGIKNILCIVVDNKKNCGIHFSRVQGLMHSRGDYILFLDQDDEISSIYIREQLCALRDYDAIICNGKNNSNLIYRTSSELESAIDESKYRKGYNKIVSPGQVLLKRETIPIEWINNILVNNGADDYFLWMLLFWKKHKVGIQEKVLYWHLISDENTSKNAAQMDNSVFEMIGKLGVLGCLTLEEMEEIRKTRLISIDDRDISIEDYKKEKNYKIILEKWMLLRERNISVDRFLSKKNIRKIAIYGGGILARHLYYELIQNNILVECLLDQNKRVEISGIETIVPGEKMESVDAIIVTPFMEYIKIREELKKLYPFKIISIETVLQNADCELMTEYEVDVKMETELEKFRNYTRILEQWIALKQINISFASWFEENNFHKIAVYGMGRIGQLFINELTDSNVEICYGIDKGQIAGMPEVKVISPEDEFDEVDLIVVTAMAEFQEIKKGLREKVNCPVVSLEDIVYELY